MLLTERLSALICNAELHIMGDRKYSKKRLYVEKQLSMKKSSPYYVKRIGTLRKHMIVDKKRKLSIQPFSDHILKKHSLI